MLCPPTVLPRLSPPHSLLLLYINCHLGVTFFMPANLLSFCYVRNHLGPWHLLWLLDFHLPPPPRYNTSCLPTCMHYISIKIQFVPLFWQRLKQKEQVEKKQRKKINFNWKSLPRTFSPLSLCCQLLIFFFSPIPLLSFFFMPIFFFFFFFKKISSVTREKQGKGEQERPRAVFN